MAFTYDLSSSIGQIRLLVPDNQETIACADDTTTIAYIYDDSELTAFLTLEGDNVRRAAALALETMASNEVFILKYISLQDNTSSMATNGPAVSAELRARAKDLRAQALFFEEREDSGAFDWAEMIDTTFQVRERFRKQWLRGTT